MTQSHTNQITRAAGILLISASILALLIMFMHPEVNADTTRLAMQEIVDESTIGSFVHGALIALLGVFVFGYTALTMKLHVSKVLATTGLAFYLFGAFAYTQAALISGFISPVLADSFVAGEISTDSVRAAMSFAHLSNQAFAKFAVFVTGIAFMFWSVIFWQARFRFIAISGFLIGTVPVLGLVSGTLDLHVSGMTLVVFLQVVWNVLIGWFLVTDKSLETDLGSGLLVS